MKPALLHHVLQAAEQLAAKDRFGSHTDAELWRCFVDTQDDAAFALLVRRHGALVWGVCRHVLGNDADAEDAFQATFLVFLRHAKRVHKPAALGSWFHGVAYRVALKAKRTLARRRHYEGAAATTEANVPISEATWTELQSAVHEEVHCLPETLRTAFVLCCLQGTPQQDAATQLGWKIGTLSGRLTKARQTLLERLTRRGMALPVVSGGLVLAELSSAGVPVGLIQRTLELAIAARVPVAIINLARGVTTMYFTRNRMALAAAVMLGLLTTGFGTGFFSKADAQAPLVAATPKPPAKMFWEYKLVPMAKDYTEKEFLAFLSDMEAKGSWEYAGTQNIRNVADLKLGAQVVVSQHMVFKRRIAIVATDDSGTTTMGLEKLAAQAQQEIEQARLAAANQLRVQQEYSPKMEQTLAEKRDAEARAKRAYRDSEEDAKQAALAKLAVQQVEAEYAVAQAEVDKATAQMQIAARKFDATKTLHAKGVESQEKLRNAEAELIEAEANAKIARARLEVAKAMLQRAKADAEASKPALTPPPSSIGASGGDLAPPTSGGGVRDSSSGPSSLVPPKPKLSATKADNTATTNAETHISAVRLKHIDATAAAKVLKELLAHDTQAGGTSIVAEVRTNALLLSGSKATLDKANAIIALLDVEATKKKE